MDRHDKTRDVANRMLLAFPRTVLERLHPHLEPVEFTRQQVIQDVGAPIEHLHFVDRGLISQIKAMQDGRVVEIGAVGIESAVGLFALHGVQPAIWEAVVQVPGTAHRIPIAVLQEEIAQSAPLRRLIDRYTHLAVSELAQTAACNRLHSLEERCCRWLLIAHDSAGGDTFPLTHEFLALMLGVQRAGLSLTANVLQKNGLIRYTRGRVTIANRAGLEGATCECYRTIRTQLKQIRSDLERL